MTSSTAQRCIFQRSCDWQICHQPTGTMTFSSTIYKSTSLCSGRRKSSSKHWSKNLSFGNQVLSKRCCCRCWGYHQQNQPPHLTEPCEPIESGAPSWTSTRPELLTTRKATTPKTSKCHDISRYAKIGKPCQLTGSCDKENTNTGISKQNLIHSGKRAREASGSWHRRRTQTHIHLHAIYSSMLGHQITWWSTIAIWPMSREKDKRIFWWNLHSWASSAIWSIKVKNIKWCKRLKIGLIRIWMSSMKEEVQRHS